MMANPSEVPHRPLVVVIADDEALLRTVAVDALEDQANRVNISCLDETGEELIVPPGDLAPKSK